VSEAVRLHHYLPEGRPGTTSDPDTILDHFLDWVARKDLDLYPEQEEAILEVLADRHVVLSTPTGSGKSMVALALHWKALCEGRRSFYTAPVKALVSEKFFDLCEEFGPERVGMLTGDASVNHDAPVICCTTEVLANMALRSGDEIDAPYVVLDEFHYYADRDRGVSWQVPLITLKNTLFLMMSATVGNTARIEERLRDYSGRAVAHVHSDVRPVPLDFEYRETSLHQTLEELHETGRSPIYTSPRGAPARASAAVPNARPSPGCSRTPASTPPTGRTSSASWATASGYTTPGCFPSTACSWSSSPSRATSR
jgi:superfamily II RNA helicase